MKHIFIINPTAGKSDSRQKIYDMADRLRREHDLDVQCILTKKQGHATELARKLCESGEDLRFYACGGDGTVNEVANGIIGYDNAAMTVIPVGTGNDFLKNFGDDAEKFRDAENLWNGPQFPMDAIDVNGRVALTIACSGIDARVAADVHKYSESPLLDGKGSYIYSLAVNFLFKGIGSHWTVTLDGVDFTALKGKRLQAARRSVQMVFQDPYSSLNPRMSVGAMLKEVLQVHHVCPKDEMDARVAALLEMVGLAPDAAQRSPGEFSGGQRQRIGIARTLALQPKLLIADEAVSALDVSVQAQIINLLEELQKSLHLTMLFISHDLSVVRCMTDRAVVMYLGKIMEMGPTEHLFGAPAHPYTRNLIDAVPEPDPDCPPKESTMIGEPPSPMDIPGGCRFHPRCPYAKNVCRRAQPELTDLGGGHFAACHFPYACAGAPQTEAEQ